MPIPQSLRDTDGDGTPDENDEDPYDSSNNNVVVNAHPPVVEQLTNTYSAQFYNDTVAALYYNGVFRGFFDFTLGLNASEARAGELNASAGTSTSTGGKITITTSGGGQFTFTPIRPASGQPR